jgi:hypothetical protein
MDWPIFSAIGGVSVLAVAITLGTVAMVRATPEPSTKTVIAMAPLLRFEPRPDVGLRNGPEPVKSSPADYDAGAPTPVPPTKAAPQVSLSAPSEQPVRPVARPREQNRSLADGPVTAKPMLPNTRIAPSSLRPGQKEAMRRPTHAVITEAPRVLIVGLD